jgi:hypothetical protein
MTPSILSILTSNGLMRLVINEDYPPRYSLILQDNAHSTTNMYVDQYALDAAGVLWRHLDPEDLPWAIAYVDEADFLAHMRSREVPSYLCHRAAKLILESMVSLEEN